MRSLGPSWAWRFRMVGSIPTLSLWAGMRTAVLWDGGLGAIAGEVVSLSNAKQPIRTSENQTHVKSAGRHTNAITRLLSMAPASASLFRNTRRQPTRHGAAFRYLLGSVGEGCSNAGIAVGMGCRRSADNLSPSIE